MPGKQAPSKFVTAQARIECRLTILKSHFEAKRAAVIFDAAGYVAHDEHGRGVDHHRTFFGHRAGSRFTRASKRDPSVRYPNLNVARRNSLTAFRVAVAAASL